MTGDAERLLRQIYKAYPNPLRVEYGTFELNILRDRGLIYLSGFDSRWAITNKGRSLFEKTQEASDD